MECCVCMAACERTLPLCGHSLCRLCETEWRRRSSTCPLCRRDLLPFDSELVDVTIHFLGDDTRWLQHVGVRCTSDVGAVRVTKIHPRDRAKACGLRVGDLITHIDHAPVGNDPQFTVALIDERTRRQVPFTCTLLRAKSLVRLYYNFRAAFVRFPNAPAQWNLASLAE